MSVDFLFKGNPQIRQCSALEEVGRRGAVLDAAPFAWSDLRANEGMHAASNCVEESASCSKFASDFIPSGAKVFTKVDSNAV